MHITKFTKAACGHVFAHCERKKSDGSFVKCGNENIDYKLTHNNYNLHMLPDGYSQGSFVKTRCAEVKCLKRKNVNVVCSCVVTLPDDFEGDSKAFFKAMYDFLCMKFGKENTISSWVHCDEIGTSENGIGKGHYHMHFLWVPITADGTKVSAKEVINRGMLTTFHTDAIKYLKSKNIEAHLLNASTEKGNKSIRELKRKTAIDEIRAVKRSIRRAKAKKEQIDSDIATKENELANLSSRISTLSQDRAVEIIAQQYVKKYERLEMPEHQLSDVKEQIKQIANGVR